MKIIIFGAGQAGYTAARRLKQNMPEAEVLDVFRLKYDYHNIKTLLKAPQNNCFFWAACRRPFLCGGAQRLNG